MMGFSHRIAGVVSWLAVAPELGTHGVISYTLVGTAFAGATANGRMSPDMDRYPWLTKIIPGGHRGILHWWVLPALGLWYVAHMVGPYQWQVAAVVVAWTSHILTDGVFGRIPLWYRPLRGRWVYGGLKLKTGGRIEKWVVVPLMGGYGVWLVAALMGLRFSL
jgi:hypothetical protein